MKKVVKLDNYYYLDELKAALETFHIITTMNAIMNHWTISHLPIEYFERKEQVQKQRAKIKQQTLLKRRSLYRKEKLLSI